MWSATFGCRSFQVIVEQEGSVASEQCVGSDDKIDKKGPQQVSNEKNTSMVGSLAYNHPTGNI